MTEKPEIDFPEGAPPTELEIIDLTDGDGAEATAGATVVVHYVGVAYSTGEEFDASWNRGEPLRVPARRRQGHRRLGPGRRGHEGRRPSPADHPAAPRATATVVPAPPSPPARR